MKQHAPMLRYSRSFLAAACFVTVLAAFVLIGTLSPSYQKCAAEHERHDGHNKQSDLQETITSGSRVPLFFQCEGAFIDENNGTLTALATIAIAGFTLTLWRSTSQQAKLTRDAIELSRDEFNATHRPKIRVKHVFLTNEIWKGERITVDLVLVNSGTAEAVIEQGRFRALLVDSDGDLPPNPPFEAGDAFFVGNRRLPVGMTWGFGLLDAANLVLTDRDNVAIREREKKLYFIGTVDYFDKGGGRRQTAFCHVLKLPDKPKSYLDMGRFVPHKDPDYEYED